MTNDDDDDDYNNNNNGKTRGSGMIYHNIIYYCSVRVYNI